MHTAQCKKAVEVLWCSAHIRPQVSEEGKAATILGNRCPTPPLPSSQTCLAAHKHRQVSSVAARETFENGTFRI